MALWPRILVAHDSAQRSGLLTNLLRPFARPTDILAWDLVAITHAGTLPTTSAWRSKALAMIRPLIDAVLADRARRGDKSRMTSHETQALEALGRALAYG